jgi:hypothetical protein
MARAVVVATKTGIYHATRTARLSMMTMMMEKFQQEVKQLQMESK